MPRRSSLSKRVRPWLKALGYRPAEIVAVSDRRAIARCPDNKAAPFLFIRQLGPEPQNLVCGFGLHWLSSIHRRAFQQAMQEYDKA